MQETETPSIPDTALPPGVDAEAYIADKTATTSLPEPTIKTVAEHTSRRPEYIEAKYWDDTTQSPRLEAMAKSLKELERQFTQQRQNKQDAKDEPATAEAEAVEKPDGPPQIKAEPEGEDVETGTEPASVIRNTFSEVAERFAETQEVTDDDYAALEKIGIDREIVDIYLDGHRARAGSAYLSAQEAVGGGEALNTMLTWAATGLTEADIEYCNTQLADPKTTRQGAEWLAAKYRAANPSEGRFVEAEPASPTGDVFQSTAQMTAAMQDPRYASDPAFRAEVAAKLQRSIAAGTMSRLAQHYR